MKKRVVFLREIFQQVFSGFAHEHSGEMLSLSEKNQILSNDLTSATVKDKQYTKIKHAA